MSNFSKISKSVKKSLCVLASASSIFSILPTAMAMEPAPKTNLSEENEAQQPIEQGEHERFKKLVEYFNEHCKKCAEFLRNHRDDIDKQVLEKEREKGLDDDTINRSLSGNTEDVQREIFEEYHIANCRIGTAAVVLKARELGLNVKKILLVETEKFNDIYSNIYKGNHAHVFPVVMCQGEKYIFDIVNAMNLYLLGKTDKEIEDTFKLDLDIYIANLSAATANELMIRYRYAVIVGDGNGDSDKTYKKIYYSLILLKSGQVLCFAKIESPEPGEEVIFQLQN